MPWLITRDLTKGPGTVVQEKKKKKKKTRTSDNQYNSANVYLIDN